MYNQPYNTKTIFDRQIKLSQFTFSKSGNLTTAWPRTLLLEPNRFEKKKNRHKKRYPVLSITLNSHKATSCHVHANHIYYRNVGFYGLNFYLTSTVDLLVIKALSNRF